MRYPDSLWVMKDWNEKNTNKSSNPQIRQKADHRKD